MTHEEFIERAKKANNDNYEILSIYANNWKQNIEVICKVCGKEGKPRVDTLLRGRKCPGCSAKKYSKAYTKTTDTYRKEVLEKGRGNYELVGEYSGVKSRIQIKHLKCGHAYDTYPYLFNKGRRCPKCKLSKGETAIADYLDSKDIDYDKEVNNTVIEGLAHRYSYDFYVPSRELLIEYQGLQHYEPVEAFGGEANLKRQQANDRYKRQFAKDNGYTLVEVPYTLNKYEDIVALLEKFLG